MNIKIICDSISNIEKDFAQKHNVTVMPLKVLIGGKEYLDGIDIESQEFFEVLKSTSEIPKTSQVSSGMFLNTFKEHLDNANIVLYIGGSSMASGTFQSANIAKDELENENLFLFDSMNISVGCGILVYKAVELIENGATIEEILDELAICRDKVFINFTVDTLEYLKKGGRISGTKATLGTVLGIKPIFTVSEGMPLPVAQIRGSKKTMKKIVSDVIASYSGEKILIGYGDNKEAGIELKNTLQEELGLSDDVIEFLCIGICISSHTGYTGYAIAYIK